jgi:VWFA-related protein
MVESIARIPPLLKAQDRFRILTIGLSVFHAVGWTGVDQPIPSTTVYPVADISLVYDGIYAAATHVEGPGRRHLVVAMTDGQDACSLITPEQIRQLGRRTEAVVHWVRMGGQSGLPVGTAGPACGGPGRFEPGLLSRLADDTGGTVRDGGRASDIAATLERVLDDSRTSYLLSFTPEGVSSTGWHRLSVKVTSGRYTVRSRSGYFAEGDGATARP